jgi:hypothetical protein
MKLRFLLPGLLALVLFAAACSPPQLRDPNMLQDTSLISGEPCEAPCWRGITPGTTSWSDALTILEDDTTIENLQTQTDDNSNAALAQWNQKGGADCCQMFSDDGETVSVLLLRVAPAMTLGQVIDRYGEPTYVVGSTFTDDQAALNVIYPDKNMVIYVFSEGTSGAISESSEVFAVLYVVASQMELLIQTSELHAWDGYGSFEQYADTTTDFEVTPAITLTPTETGG